ncbi:hypothetical protein ACLI4Z_10570 [Natrialbaceae archaeon A-arb3/5]
MNRRAVLAAVSTGFTIGGPGCISLERPGPVDFALLNFIVEENVITVTISDDETDTVLEETYEIDRWNQSARIAEEIGFTEAMDGDRYDVTANVHGGPTDEQTYYVSYNESNMSDPILYVAIHPPDDENSDFDERIEISAADCGNGTE